MLKVAADIKAAAPTTPSRCGGSRTTSCRSGWSRSARAYPGYVTPKVAVGAVVGNDEGEILLVQRADSGIWLYPTGWADIGYSPAEVALKEVHEETGIVCEPVQLLARDRRPAHGFHPLRHVHAAVPLPGRRRLARRPIRSRRPTSGWFGAGRAAVADRRRRRGGGRWRSPPSGASGSRPRSIRPGTTCGARARNFVAALRTAAPCFDRLLLADARQCVERRCGAPAEPDAPGLARRCRSPHGCAVLRSAPTR